MVASEPAPLVREGDGRGVVCVHGFTATHHDMRHVVEALHARGMTVVAPLLPGHHTLPTDLNVTTWRDWFAAVQAPFDELAERCDQGVAVVGQSLGGLLALHLAAQGPERLRAVASLAAPLWLRPLPTWISRIGRRFPWLTSIIPTLPKLGGVDARSPAARRESRAYTVIPVRGLTELVDLMTTVRSELAAVRCPLFIGHGRHDHTAPYACSTALMRGVSSATLVHREFPRSFHNLALDVERDQVAGAVADFLVSQFADT